jgi:ABC-type multidrug transport system fused ATPase/permease subunit
MVHITDSAKLLAAEMAGALARARQTLDPVVFLGEFRDLLKKHESASRALLQSLLSSLGEDFLVPLAEKVPEEDEEETGRFASLYAEVGDLVRALAPASPLAKRREAEQQVLEGIFRKISRRNQSEEAEKKKVVEEQYKKLLEARRRDVRRQPEVKSLVTRAIGFVILGVFALVYYDPAYFESGIEYQGFWSTPMGLGVVIGAIFGLVAGGLPGILSGGLLGLFASAVFIRLGLYIGLGAFVIAGVYFFRFQQRMKAVQLTTEESAARHESIKNIEDYFRLKEELERARTVVAVAKGEAPERSFPS